MSIPIPIVIPRTRKGVNIMFFVLLVASLIGAAIVLTLWTIDQNNLKEYGQPDFNTLSIDELKSGMIVKGKIDIAFDTFAEEYETEYGRRTSDQSEKLYYVVPVYNTDAEGYFDYQYVLCFITEPSDFQRMDEIFEQTWSDEDMDTKVTVTNGVITDMSGDIKQFYYEWADSPEFYDNGSFIDWCMEYNIFGTSDENEIRSRIVPYCISKTASAGTSLDGFWACIIFAALFTAAIIAIKVFNKPMKGVDGPDDKLF